MPRGQLGHPGSTLEWVEEVDEEVAHRANQCQRCGESLAEVPVLEWALRQVHDLPPMGLEVTGHQVDVKSCLHCYCLNRGEFPADVTHRVQYGAGVKGLAVYLMDYQLWQHSPSCR
jgi:transposase